MSRDSDFLSNDEQPQTPASLIAPDQQPCPECRGQMVEGWVPEHTDQPGTIAISAWYPGPPRTMPGLFHMVRVLPPNPKEAIPLRAFRCVRCGFLKFYARAVG